MQRPGTLNAFILPRLRDIIFIIVFIGALALGPRMLNTDSDIGRDLTLGQFILNTHQIPTRDLLSFTKANQPRPPYEWLAQVLFATAYRLLNLDGVVLLTAIILAWTFAFVYQESTQQSIVPLLSLSITLWAAIASSIHWLTRPHIFSFLFLAIWIHLLERIRTSKTVRLWLLPLLMLVWANTHGGFVFGFLSLGAYLAGWLIDYWRKSTALKIGKSFLIVGTTSLIASIITPDFWHNWDAVFRNNSTYILSRTAETMPPNFATPAIWPFAGLLALTLVLFLLNWRQAASSHFFLLAGLAFASLLIARNIPLFAIAAAPILSEWAAKMTGAISCWTKTEEAFMKIEETLRGSLWPLLIVVTATAFFVYYKTTSKVSFYQFSRQVFPVQAVDWIETHPINGNMFNDSNWGGYLLYRLWPSQSVFVDSQSDFYGETFMRQYSSIYSGESNWDTELAQYKVGWVIVPREASLAKAASQSTDWQAAYQDSVAIIFERK